jgi:hypothetical protein
MKNETKGIAPLIIAVVVIVVAAGVGVGAYVVTRGGGGGTGGGNGNIGDATSLSFDVAATVGEQSVSYTFKAKDLGSTNAKLRVDMTTAGTTIGYIINGALQKVWVSYGGTWTELPGEYSTQWSTWDATLSGYETSLAGWTSGTYTSPDGSVTISNVQVNPTLADSLFEV